jgi:Fe-S cluster assembly scaffold protein SufB
VSNITIHRQKSDTKPIDSITISESGTHVEIIADDGVHCSVSLILEAPNCTISVTAKKNSELTVNLLQTSNGTISQKSQAEEGASVRFVNITLAEVCEHDLESHLIGANAKSDVDWMFYATGQEKHTLSARNVFDAQKGGGQITMKGVAEGESEVKCDGLIDISDNGKGTDTYLTEDILMLDKTARVDAIPGLEIKTNDVKASHSATVSKVTPEDLFYFASRGIDEKAARHMYVRGFLGELTSQIEDSSIAELVHEAIERKYVI